MNEKKIRIEFGQKVKYYRKLSNLTQNELSRKVNKTEETISNIERGITSINLEFIEELAIALNIKVVDFFENKEIITTKHKENFEAIAEIVKILEKKSLKYLKSLQIIIDN